MHRGEIYYEQGEWGKAVADYSEAIRLDPQNPLAYGKRGAALLENKDYDNAIADLNDAIGLDPAYADAYSDRGIAWMEKKEYGKALADLDEALRLQPGDKRIAARRNDLLVESNQREKLDAEMAAAAAETVPHGEEQAYIEKGSHLIEQGKYAEAITALNEAIRLNPYNGHAYSWRSEAYRALGNEKAARQDFDASLKYPMEEP